MRIGYRLPIRSMFNFNVQRLTEFGMPSTTQIKAYIQDASGDLVPRAAHSLVLEFPAGPLLEVT